MAIGSLKALARDEAGAALLEFTVVVFTFLVLLFGVIEFTLAFFQWNSASKAMQVGARLAAVSAPVWEELATLNGAEGGAAPGTYLDVHVNPGVVYDYKVVCNGSTTSCSPAVMNVGVNPGTTFNAGALGTIVFGRGSTACNDGGQGSLSALGMCDIFPRIATANVIITYQHTNSGYATRPGGLVPTITLELTGINFQFVFLDDLLNLGQIAIPGLKTTLVGEDLRSSAPAF